MRSQMSRYVNKLNFDLLRSKSNFLSDYFKLKKHDNLKKLELRERKEMKFQTELIKMKRNEDK